MVRLLPLDPRCRKAQLPPRQRLARSVVLMPAVAFVLFHCAALDTSPSWKNLAFTGCSAQSIYEASHRQVVTLRRGIFEDLQKSLTDTAVQAASGLSKEENEALLENCKSGKMSVNEYLTVMKMFGKLGEVGDAVAPLKNMLNQGSTTESIEEAKEKSALQEKMVKAMTDEELQNPDVFFEPGPPGRKALARWATAAGKSEQEMMDFLLEYRTMKSMFGKLGQGEDFSDVQKELKKETEELRSSTKSRKARRSSKTKTGRGGKQPEWNPPKG